VLFKTVCDNYDLLPAENYKLPPEAEGLEPTEEANAPTLSILKSEASSNNKSAIEEEFMSVGRTNTRRHIRQSPSVGSAVTTVLESDEEDPDVTQKLEDLHIDGGESGNEIPVIVETHEINQDETVEGRKGSAELAEPSQTGEHSVQGSTASWDQNLSESIENKPETLAEAELADEHTMPPAKKEVEDVSDLVPEPIESTDNKNSRLEEKARTELATEDQKSKDVEVEKS